MRNLFTALTVCLILLFTQTANASLSTTTPLSQIELKFFKKQHNHLVEAAEISGIKVSVLAAIGNMESGLGLNRRNLAGSGAGGVMGYTPRTWKYDLKNHGKKAGLSKNASRHDDRSNIILAAVTLRENKKYLQELTGKDVTDAEAYLTHFIGFGGTIKLLNGKQNAPISRYIRIHKGNGDLYYHNGKIATVAQFRANMRKKVERESKRFKVAMRIQQQKQLDKLLAGIMVKYNDYNYQVAMK